MVKEGAEVARITSEMERENWRLTTKELRGEGGPINRSTVSFQKDGTYQTLEI